MVVGVKYATRAGVYETLRHQHELAPKDNPLQCKMPKSEKGDNSATYQQNFAKQ